MLIENAVRHSKCPLCAAHELYKVGELTYREKTNFSSHVVELSHIPEMWRCQGCLSCFVQNAVDVVTAQELYSTGQPAERWSKLAFEKGKTNEVVKHMAEIFRSKANVLDVGCNTGELLDYAKSLGCLTAGVEFSAASRKLLNEKGHGAFATLDESQRAYDIITAFDLVEHLYDIPAFLRDCREMLSPDGRLVILTGNISSISARLSANRWWYAQYPEHIAFPSKRFFMEISGFRVEKWVLTYASKGYRFPIRSVIPEIYKSIFRREMFNGLPPIGPDHVLVILKK